MGEVRGERGAGDGDASIRRRSDHGWRRSPRCRRWLSGPLKTIFRDERRPDVEHILATSILGDYGRDDPAFLAELILESDPAAFKILFPHAQHQAERVRPLLEAELSREVAFRWQDRAIESSWTKPGSDLVERINSAMGRIEERFAFCQTMTLGDFLKTAEDLRPAGYRPIRIRPYDDLSVVRVAAVWVRDQAGWAVASGLSSDQAPTTGRQISSRATGAD